MDYGLMRDRLVPEFDIQMTPASDQKLPFANALGRHIRVNKSAIQIRLRLRQFDC